MSEDTRILYCTTGVLLEKLVQSKTLSHFTHIVLDEVHERDKDMDFLFIIIRMLMAKEATNVRIVLMSATIDTAKVNGFIRVSFISHEHSHTIFCTFSLLNTFESTDSTNGFQLQLYELINVVYIR